MPASTPWADAGDKRMLTNARFKRDTSEQGMVANNRTLETPNLEITVAKQATDFLHMAVQKLSFKIVSKGEDGWATVCF